MRKTWINLLSIAIICIVCASVLLPGINMFSQFCEGFKQGYKAGVEEQISPEELEIPININFIPEGKTYLHPNDSIIFENGQKLPILIDKVSVLAPQKSVSTAWQLIIMIAYPLEILLLIPMIWAYIKFMINIYRQKIFIRKNASLLRRFSYFLLIITALEILSGIGHECIFDALSFSMKGYTLGADWIFPWGDLLLGALGLLMAEIWMLGIKIREEQELTI